MNTILRQAIAATLGMCVCAGAGAAGEQMELKSDTDKASYALGYQIGGDFKRQKMDLHAPAVVRGIADAQSGAAPLMNETDMRNILIEVKRRVVEQERSAAPEVLEKTPGKGASQPDAKDQSPPAAQPHAKRAAAKPTEDSKAFFDKNAKREGVVTLPSGLQYKVLKEGAGRNPQAADKVTLIYRGTLANGNEFADTRQDGKAAPRTYALKSLVPGLREAVSHMKEGAQWQVFVPPQLGFDASTPLYRKITVFDIQLVAVSDK
jgi:FKBP-type peptidyl-prolyl cis-trans isomerase FklB